VAHQLVGTGTADPFEEKCGRAMVELCVGVVYAGLGDGEERHPQRAFFTRVQA